MQEKDGNINTSPLFENVGRARLSLAKRAISIKLLKEKRYFHISLEDIEKIIADKSGNTVSNVREYHILTDTMKEH